MWTMSMRYKRVRIKLENYIKNRHELNTMQLKAIKIVRRLLTKTDIEAHVSPHSGERFIHYKDIFVKIFDERVQIINHHYSYDISLPKDIVENDLIKMFDRRTEMELNKMRREITTNINSSLGHLLEELESTKK